MLVSSKIIFCFLMILQLPDVSLSVGFCRKHGNLHSIFFCLTVYVSYNACKAQKLNWMNIANFMLS